MSWNADVQVIVAIAISDVNVLNGCHGFFATKTEFRRCAVLGAGTMGAGIAAQIANAGVAVLLYDVNRAVAEASLARLAQVQPPAFMVGIGPGLVAPRGIDTDLAELAACDWIVEAIVENLEIKRNLYAAVAAHMAPGSIISSNTSTIPLADLVANAPPQFRRRFLVTHFFNPPRYMRLLEVVAGQETDAAAVNAVVDFADRRLGKGIVMCKDRPGFIANRLGCFWSQCAVAAAFAQGLIVEEADAVMGKPFGIPSTGVFGLMDLVGIDLMPHVNESLARLLGPDDLFHQVNVHLPFVEKMIAEGFTGRKGKGGFYRINREQGKRKEVIDLTTGDYFPIRPVAIEKGEDMLFREGRLGDYARAVMLPTLAYAAMLVGDAADDIHAIDEAMRLGYNWAFGPFELIDRIGSEKFCTLIKDVELPVAPLLDKAAGRPLLYRRQHARPRRQLPAGAAPRRDVGLCRHQAGRAASPAQ